MSAWFDTLNCSPLTPLPTTLEASFWVDLDHLAQLELSGHDTLTFLQGQLSSNLQRLTPAESQLSSYNTPKGRMTVLPRLLMTTDQRVVMVAPQSLVERFQPQLQRFILRAAVKMERRSSEAWLTLGWSGGKSEEVLERYFGRLPTEPNGTLQQGESLICRVAGVVPRYLVITPAAEAVKLIAAGSGAVPRCDRVAWDRQEIHAGLPTIEAATVEAFVPQMVNLHLLGGVSFKKGCYTGQEVVARMQYLGKLKRRMYRAHTDSPEPPAIGTEIDSPHSSSGQGAGKVVLAAPAVEGGADLLVVLELAALEAGDLHLASNGSRLTLCELPYPLELEGVTQQ